MSSRPENLSKGQLAQNQSQVVQRGNKQIYQTLETSENSSMTASENNKATPGLAHRTYNVEERFRWQI